MSAPLLTVAICTYNRAGDLARALQSLKAEVAREGFALIVVDNGSTDETAAVLSRAQSDLPQLQCVIELTPGLSAARNRALQTCTTPLIAYLDDDAVAEPGWSAALIGAFQREGPRTAAIGGRIAPDWEIPPPPWITPQLASYYSALDQGHGTHRLETPRIFGANMAFRTTPLREAGGFSLRLGRRGSNLNGNEEIAPLISLMRRGYCLAYCGGATVHHKVPRSRLNQTWLMSRVEGQGRSDAILFTRVIPAPRAAMQAGFSAIRDSLRKRGFERAIARAYLRGFAKGIFSG